MGHYVPGSPSPLEGPLFSSSEYDEIWRVLEEKNAVLLSQIQPSKRSEECRRGVIDFVKSLLESQLHCKVFSFGSVPLKTYLPDGDIDLTAIGSPPPLERQHYAWAERVRGVLEREERIHFKEVKCIHAEVPVVKCLVENIIVDITFNQLGGLSTLCFLEEVDKLIGQDHLFKKSIILVKAWCFYESRILGAHHGLLSTYALEVLVLYVFQAYHKSLRGPLQVLYRFLRFFSKFDWENFCLSPWGPIPLGLLDIDEIPPPISDGNFLLSDEFLRTCRKKYSAHLENNQGKGFTKKYMNLVDPLRPFNNLGRSVNSGNLVRIYSAFTYGAARLEKLLQSPSELTCANLASFFRNTQKHCEGQRPDAGFLSFRGDTLCNGNTKTHELTSGATATSGTLNNMCDSKCRILNGAHADKSVSDDLSCPSLQVDSPKENSDASLDERAVRPTENSRDNGPVSSGDERADAWRCDCYSTDKCDKCLVNLSNSQNKCFNHSSISDKCLVNLLNSNAVPEAQSSDPSRGIKGSLKVSKDSKVDTESQECLSSPASTPKLNSASLEPSSVEELFLEGDLRGSMQLECRDTDAAILEGNLEMYLENLNSGWKYQIKKAYGVSRVHSGACGWESPERSMFMHGSSGRNIPVHIGTPCLPIGAILGSLPKSAKGTGTFFPNLSTNLERDKRVYASGVRSPRRNMDSFNSANHTVMSASKLRSNVPKRRDGPNKGRSRKTIDLKTEEYQELSTEVAITNSEQSPRVDIGDEFNVSFERHMDRGGDAQLLTSADWPPRSLEAGIAPACRSNNKDMSIGKLEFGSFGPGFLATGLHRLSEQEHTELSSQIQGISPRDGGLKSKDMCSKAGHHNDRQQSIYYLKEEDFPPLT